MEYLSYGGGNNSMWTNDASYFKRIEREDSTFGLPLLHLDSVCWMNPWAVVEKIPANATKIDVFIYHIYHNGFRMNNTCEIKIAAEDEITEPREHEEHFT